MMMMKIACVYSRLRSYHHFHLFLEELSDDVVITGNTTNLLAHLNSAHSAEIASELDGKTSLNKQKPKQMTLPMTIAKPASIKKLSTEKIAELDDRLTRLIVGKVLPLSLVDSPFFKDFVGSLDPRQVYSVPSRKKIHGMLKLKKAEITEKIMNELKKCGNAAITHDGWTSIAQESYQTITCHYINEEWELKSVVLETKKITGSHTGEAIAESIKETVTKWSLDSLPSPPIAVTDNAANEMKAFEILKWERFGCYGHRLNLAVKKGLEIKELSKILAKGRKLVTYFHQSSSASDLLKEKQTLLLGEDKQHRLIQDCPTRWNSSLAMMKRLLEQTPAIVAM
ncbi:hypothetical protein FSP39_002934 [Pinctada imbricata]|uniref:Uncharacterized protein n=1 Tax=Pinctada imbricata TaxID=66713 RepID=A0AA88YLJ6_PINIB|nr:hypothetical protein FSP39_002934 [Pinctada imbricata]